MALADTFVRQAKHSGSKVGDKHSDGGGLYLHITASGKYWRMAYRLLGKQKTLAIGVYPAVSLAQARKARDEAKALVAQDLDPSQAKRKNKAALKVAAANTFEAVALEFHMLKSDSWSPRYSDRWLSILKTYLFPALGKRPIAEITARELLDVLRVVEKRGIYETAHTLRQNAGQVFRYGLQTDRCERDPATDLHGALKPVSTQHMAAILEPAKAGELLRAIDGYTGYPITRVALALSALLFQRPGNIRQLEWGWVDMEKAMIIIPAASMKRTKAGKINGRPHFVPLAPQAIELLQELQPLTGSGRFLFPSLRTGERPMSDNTINAALRRLGFPKEEMSAHGFRAMARTLIAEQLPGISTDVIEAQLAHGKSGPLGMAYDRAEFMQQRRQAMQAWADYLDKLRKGADVIELHGKAA
jgi:integrase